MPTNTYTLSGDAGIREIDQIWKEIRDRLEQHTTVELDAAAVVRPDTALAQLLTVAVVRAREQGKTVRINNPSQRLSELLALLAIDVVLGGSA
ncbi:MAG: STAS domain-containing protein [Burkholderiales bacterium]